MTTHDSTTPDANSRPRRLGARAVVLTTVLLGLTGVGAAALLAGADRQETVAVMDDATTTSSVPEETTTSTTPPETTTTTTTVATTTTTTGPPTMPAASCHPLPQESVPPSHMDVWVTLEKTRFAPGEAVAITAHARNRSDTDETYHFNAADMDVEVVVHASDGTFLWRVNQPDGTTGAPAVRNTRVFPAGGEVSQRFTWQQSYCTRKGDSGPVRLPSGKYTARGFWARGQWWSAPVDFEIG